MNHSKLPYSDETTTDVSTTTTITATTPTTTTEEVQTTTDIHWAVSGIISGIVQGCQMLWICHDKTLRKINAFEGSGRGFGDFDFSGSGEGINLLDIVVKEGSGDSDDGSADAFHSIHETHMAGVEIIDKLFQGNVS